MLWKKFTWLDCDRIGKAKANKLCWLARCRYMQIYCLPQRAEGTGPQGRCLQNWRKTERGRKKVICLEPGYAYIIRKNHFDAFFSSTIFVLSIDLAGNAYKFIRTTLQAWTCMNLYASTRNLKSRNVGCVYWVCA